MVTEPTTSEDAVTAVAGPRHSRLNQTLAWVGIIAGGLFIVGVIFVSGVYAGMATDGYRGWHRGSPVGQSGPAGPMECPMMRRGGAMGASPGATMTPNQGAPRPAPAT